MAAGTKTAYLPFALSLAAGLAFFTLKNKSFKALLLSAALFVACGGWHYMLLWASCGNPLFPLHLQLGGHVIFAGAYDAAAVRSGEFHSGSAFETLILLWHGCGPCFTVLCAAGLVFALRSVFRKDCRQAGVGAALFFAVLWAAVYVWIIPHNTEIRFFLPAAGLFASLFFCLLPAGRAGELAGAGAFAVIFVSFVQSCAAQFPKFSGLAVPSWLLFAALCAFDFELAFEPPGISCLRVYLRACRRKRR